MNASTIVALATCPGPGAIGVVRVSGVDALAICGAAFRGGCALADVPDRSVAMGEVVEADGAAIDRVLVLVMRGPRSYTGEDVVEISCHGGNLAPRLVLRRLIEAGAEPAGGGEFTKRAFLNGKMDLAQAEAVADIVQAGSKQALRAAVRQLKGGLSRRLGTLEADLFEMLMALEASIDFPEEEDIGPLSAARLPGGLSRVLGELDSMLAAHEHGRHLRRGLDVAIVGKPNVGKSSLFNLLVGEERAITSADPGTTRDVVDGLVNLDGVTVHLHDTAGVRVAAGGIEEEAVARTRRTMADADLVLAVVDASTPLTDEDRHILDAVGPRPHLVLANKCDLPQHADPGRPEGALEVSALTGSGLPALMEALSLYVHSGAGEVGSDIVTNERHAACIRSARDHAVRAATAVGEGLPPEFVAADMRHALDSLGEVTGRNLSEKVLDEIFARFCIGK